VFRAKRIVRYITPLEAMPPDANGHGMVKAHEIVKRTCEDLNAAIGELEANKKDISPINTNTEYT
jgi:hypothetical protein